MTLLSNLDLSKVYGLNNHGNVILKITLVLILLSFLMSDVTSKKIGNITVYVKDHDGEDVVKNKHLAGDLTVELWYDEKLYGNGSKIFPSDKDFISFDVNHTGLYTVITKATIEYKTPNQKCYVGVNKDYRKN